MEYIGLDLNNLPTSITESHDLKFKAVKGEEEKKYKQYRFVDVQDIDILVSESNTFSELKEKYENASPLYTYLETDDEESIEKYRTFFISSFPSFPFWGIH